MWFDSEDMVQAKQIAGYIVSIFVHGLKNKEEHLQIKKRHCIWLYYLWLILINDFLIKKIFKRMKEKLS